jgi:antitoxin HicB
MDTGHLGKYSRQVYWSGKDMGYIALCPEFPGISAFGESAAEALRELEMALELAVESHMEEGLSLPKPLAVPDLELPSGEFRVRLPRSLHARLAGQARREGVSQNSLVTTYIAEGLGRAAEPIPEGTASRQLRS